LKCGCVMGPDSYYHQNIEFYQKILVHYKIRSNII
jgi:hypothetical protein